jgi:Mg2+/Co2+ transporter CorC
VARNRTLIAGTLAAAKLLEVGEQEERLAAIEAALGPRVVRPESRRR